VRSCYWLFGSDCPMRTSCRRRASLAEPRSCLIAPDTSPSGPKVPGGSEGAGDFGTGAGFYLMPKSSPWAATTAARLRGARSCRRLLEAGTAPQRPRGKSVAYDGKGRGLGVSALRKSRALQVWSPAFAQISHPMPLACGREGLQSVPRPESPLECWDALRAIAQRRQRLPAAIRPGTRRSFPGESLRPQDLEEAAQRPAPTDA